MRKIVALCLALLIALPVVSVQTGAVERSLADMKVPVVPGVDALALDVPTIPRRSLGYPNVPVVLGLDANLIRMLPRDDIDMTLIRPVQYSCQRDCHVCRESCSIQWKGQCVGPDCRRGFSECMKGCWNAVCRYC